MPTDTNDTELFELCKEVYERFPEWNGTRDWIREDGLIVDYNVWKTSTPLYTSDYLLEKLPKRVDNDEVNWLDIYHEADPDCWRAGYEYAKNDKWGDSYDVVADTPLLALLKLTLALHEAGELHD